jgi:hypothetical protein
MEGQPEESEERLEEANEELGKQWDGLGVFEGVVVPPVVRQLTAPKQVE